ncbi:hypothetical protein DFQ27_004258 [Actinomortierella ambigua]|uniref:Uncharacterized protein n=1 Tax=Actinomortierella ambigua TaxID=1343610 RepID=A0A9P6Q2C5_9FUNG|nr:hypothetical protein DFQ27_004258 [Actinomortierella ambigua]
MPSIRYSVLPLFSTPGSTPRTILPRGCLTPRMLLATIVLACILSSLVIFSYSKSTFGFDYSPSGLGDDEWARLEAELLEQQQTRLASQHHGQPNSLSPTLAVLEWRNTSITSKWSCEAAAPSRHPNKNGPEYNRQTVCTITNLCVDADRGIWMHDITGRAAQMPMINVVASDPDSDAFFRPTLFNQFPVNSYRYIDETVFVYGQDPNYKHNWILNGLLPLYNIMKNHGGTVHSWFLRVRTVGYKQQIDIDTAYLAPQGLEIVMGKDISDMKPTKYHPPPKNTPTCFAKAVIGLGSACTRPYCEKYLGGSEAEALRQDVLGRLSTAMMRYQHTDPEIVHPPLGDNVPSLSENQPIQLGEFVQRRKINVALLGRYGNTSIANAQALELSLLDKGFNAKTIHLDNPSQISMAQTAQLFSDQHILVAPQGDSMGYSTLMAPGTVIVSIMPRFARSSKIYTDRMMSWGKRFFAWDCRDNSCVQAERDLAHDCIGSVAGFEEEGITAQEYEDFANMRQDFSTRSVSWKKIADCYTKEVSRRLNVDELTLFIESLAADFKPEGAVESPPPSTSAAAAAAAAVSPASGSTVARRGAEGDEDDREDDAGEMGQEHEYDDHGQTEDSSASLEGQDKVEEVALPRQKVSPKVLLPATGAPVAPTMADKNAKVVPRMSFVDACHQKRCCGAAVVGLGGSDLTPCAESLGWFVFGPRSVWDNVVKAESDAKAREVARGMVWRHDLGRS